MSWNNESTPKAWTQQDTNKADHSTYAPDLVTRFARDEASTVRRSVLIKASAMLHNRSQLDVHSICCTSSYFSKTCVAPLETIFKNSVPIVLQALQKTIKNRVAKSALSRTSANCFGHDTNLNGGSVWTRCWRRGLSSQRGATRPQLFNFAVCQGQRDTNRMGDIPEGSANCLYNLTNCPGRDFANFFSLVLAILRLSSTRELSFELFYGVGEIQKI